MRLQKSVYEALNHQMNVEYKASNIYLQMAAWAESRNLVGCSAFLNTHADEEREHMRKIFAYILERGGEPKLTEIPQPPYEYADIKDLFAHVLAEEMAVSDAIDSLAHLAWEGKDLATFQFLQWFIEEQREEEEFANEIVGKIDIIGLQGQGLYLIDEYVGGLQPHAET